MPLYTLHNVVEMGKQVMALKERGIKAEYLGSAQKDFTVQTKAEHGQFDILFMTPEKACTISTRYENKPMHNRHL